MALAGYGVEVSVATGASATYTAFDGISQFTVSDGSDLLEITDFTDSRLRRRMAGMRDISISLSGDVEAGSVAYTSARAAYEAGNPLIVRILIQSTGATAGAAYSMLLSSFERSASVDGKVELSLSLEHEGAFDPIAVGTGI